MASAPHSGGSVQSNEGAPVPGCSQAYLDTLPAAERRALLEGLARNGLLSDTERQRQAEALSAQSARQSGAATIAD